MEGPTPVSALIHAATMVAAGVYLICRVNFLITPELSNFILIIGCITAAIGAFSAVSQTDIKKVLAFSTISQLGYMMIAVGLKQYEVAVFHLLTHAFFKACLFLCAGAVIHSVHQVEEHCVKKGIVSDFDVQDMRLMGGLRKKMTVTFICYTIAAASLAGLPFLSGFLSKDAILLHALDASLQTGDWMILVPVIGFGAALLTAFYMARQLYMVFFHEYRLPKWKPAYREAAEQVKETPWMMRVPIIMLALLSCFFVFSLNPFSSDGSWIFTDLIPVRTELHYMVGGLSLMMSAAGIGIAYYYFGRKDFMFDKIDRPIEERNIITRLSFNHLYINEIYDWIIVRPVLLKASFIRFTDGKIIDGLVSVVAGVQPLFGAVVAYTDAKVINRTVDWFGMFTVFLGYGIKGLDRYVIDPLIHLPAVLFKAIGKLFKGVVSNNVQMLIAGSFLMILLLVAILNYLAF
jgi:NADH-quinone oxidoreductase subunit L